MGAIFIPLGLFLWFALAFNGSVGTNFVDGAFFASAMLMIVTGVLAMIRTARTAARISCAAALIFYLPMIWQRFHFPSGPGWVGLLFDGVIVALLVTFLAKRPRARPAM